jgi:prepilin peptidase CpaA
MPPLIWVGAVVFAIVAGTWDWRTRRIPNWLSVSGLCVGIVGNVLLSGWEGAKFSLAGAGIALGALLPLVLLGGLGAGDWKLMGALGSFLGARQFFLLLILAFLIAGLMATIQTTWQRRWRVVLKNLRDVLKGYFVYGLRPHPVVNLENPKMHSLPFGTAVAVATLICYWGMRP